MNATQWILNIGILGLMLTQVGEHAASRRRLLLPLGVVAAVAVNMLPGIPTAGNDVAFEAIGVVAGAFLGLAAAFLMRVRSREDGRVTITAGFGYAALWTAVIGGRLAFALWASGPGSRTVGTFSMAHHITGDAWIAFFVLMALAMILVRTAVVGVQVLGRQLPAFSGLSLRQR
ncbi:MAG TPA: hypothetical protein VFC09_04600 [Candidatus Dormibacteraeota bacterium]|nr:hypothetical protein [Candidatus Dormibacteraeota bacterium]